MIKIQQFMNVYNISQNQRQRVEQYYSYMFYQKTNSTILDFAELQDFLPASLVKEIIFH